MTGSKKTKIIILICAVTAVCVSTYLVYGSIRKSEQVIQPPSSNSNDGVNYSAPTEEEIKSAEDNKQDVTKLQEKESNSTPQTSTTKKIVTPIISSWPSTMESGADVSISGFISEIYEDSGVCTFTMRKTDKKISKSQEARKDAQVTTCGRITIASNKLSSGTWQATLSYLSPKAEGTSKSVSIKVK